MVMTVAIDAMGGDRAPKIVIAGVFRAALRYPQAKFLLFGDEHKIKPFLAKKRIRQILSRVEVIHTKEAIAMDDAPATAIRRGKNSSMALALKAVREQRADCAVSAGNTGALMGMAKVMLKTTAGIERPAFASLCPTLQGETVMLDLGANIDADARQLVQFAMMGKIFARAVLGLDQPSVALLNIGAEELKGRDEVKQAAARLERLSGKINYTGFIEANSITKGVVDVVVTDGYSGNIAIKAMEGIAEFLTIGLKNTYRSGILARLGFLLASSAIRNFFHQTDPRVHNGAVFLGLNGIVVKSHGGTDAVGFAHAVSLGIDMVTHQFVQEVNRQLPDFIESIG